MKLGRFGPIFLPELEGELVIKIQQMEKALFGLSTVDVRRLAFDLAEKLNLAHGFNAHTGCHHMNKMKHNCIIL